jgi:hypothetical protein
MQKFNFCRFRTSMMNGDPLVQIENDPHTPDQEELISYKYLLGDMGISMLTAIARGARTKDAIMMLSGVPMACVNGRMPVLFNLKLAMKITMDEYVITSRGMDFLRSINEPQI